MDKHKFPPQRIFNCDETGITTVQGKLSKVLAKTGRRQVGRLVSAERRQLVSVETSCLRSAETKPVAYEFG